jgi:uncharacterized protein
MNRNALLILVGAALVLFSAFFIWRHVKAPPRKLPAKRAVIRKAPSKPALPAVRKTAQVAPRIAVVIDDFGYSMNNTDGLFAIGEPVTLSILPGQPYSRRIAEAARAHGYEVILHLPLESHRNDVREEFDTIRSGMSQKEVTERLESQIADVPGLKGVSNHMGSASTEDPELMREIFVFLKKRGLYFLDSLTSQKTVCKDIAARVGLPCERRDVFLDNKSDAEYIKGQLAQARKIAYRRGRAIAICHDRKSTIAVLAEAMPEMSARGIRFVFLSELVK